jgi:hypothetical protein
MPEVDQKVKAIIDAAREHVTAGLRAIDRASEYQLVQSELEHRRDVMGKLADSMGKYVYDRNLQRFVAACEVHEQQTVPLRCSACGSRTRSACACGAAYLPPGPAQQRKGRPTIGGVAMTAAERMRRSRARKI